jgi:hypothetical protein
LTRFRFGFGFFFKKKNFGLVTCFDKNRTEPNRKWSPLIKSVIVVIFWSVFHLKIHENNNFLF